MFFPSPHTRLIDGDLNQPGAEPCFRAELPNVLEGLQHRLLRGIFGIGLIVQYGQSRRIHTSFVGSNQLIKELMLALSNAPDERLFVESLGWTIQRSHPFQHHSSPHLDLPATATNRYSESYSGSFFHPVNMETKLFQP